MANTDLTERAIALMEDIAARGEPSELATREAVAQIVDSMSARRTKELADVRGDVAGVLASLTGKLDAISAQLELLLKRR